MTRAWVLGCALAAVPIVANAIGPHGSLLQAIVGTIGAFVLPFALVRVARIQARGQG